MKCFFANPVTAPNQHPLAEGYAKHFAETFLRTIDTRDDFFPNPVTAKKIRYPLIEGYAKNVFRVARRDK